MVQMNINYMLKKSLNSLILSLLILLFSLRYLNTNSYFCFLIIFIVIVIIGFIKYRKHRNLVFNPTMNIEYEYIQDLKSLTKFTDMIIENNVKYIGLDTEYFKGSEYNGKLCLVQISFNLSNKKNNGIIDIIELEKTISKEIIVSQLKKILENEEVLKVIHSAFNDKEWIYNHYGLNTYPIYDTQEAYSKISKTKGKRTMISNNNNFAFTNTHVGLDFLLKEMLDVSIDKQLKKDFQQSNWSLRPLSKSHLNYACFDSYYLLEIKEQFDKIIQISTDDFAINNVNLLNKEDRLINKAKNYFDGNISKSCDRTDILKNLFLDLVILSDQNCQKNNINTENNYPFKLLFKIIHKLPTNESLLQEIIKKFKVNKVNNSNSIIETYDSSFNKEIIELINEYKLKINEMSITNDECLENTNELENKDNNDQLTKKGKFIKKFACNKPIYENCKMLAPSGEHLCYCDNKKMNWYITKNLAIKVSENVFKLTFKPNGVGCIDADNTVSEFYTITRDNCCVVCGKKKDYMRFHVVPVSYRQFLPNILKSHKSHDVVLLCADCHIIANEAYEKKKLEISDVYNIPLNIQSEIKEFQINLCKIINLCANIISNKGKIPNIKYFKILKVILNFLTENIETPEYEPFYKHVFKNESRENILIEIETYSKLYDLSISNNNNIDKGLLNKTDKSFSELIEKVTSLCKSIKIFSPKTLMSSSEDKKNLHGKLVLDKVKDKEEFIKSWRMFFLEALDPKFLPPQWRIEHQCIRTFGVNSTFRDSE